MPSNDRRQEPATEPDRAWRERTQRTNEEAKRLAPPHDPETERGNPAPVTPRQSR